MGSGFRGFVFGFPGFGVPGFGFAHGTQTPNPEAETLNPRTRAWVGCFGLSGRLRGKVRQGHSYSGAKWVWVP